MIARAVQPRVKRDLRQRSIIPFQWLHDEGHLGAVSAEECEIESVVSAWNTEGQRPAAGGADGRRDRLGSHRSESSWKTRWLYTSSGQRDRSTRSSERSVRYFFGCGGGAWPPSFSKYSFTISRAALGKRWTSTASGASWTACWISFDISALDAFLKAGPVVDPP